MTSICMRWLVPGLLTNAFGYLLTFDQDVTGRKTSKPNRASSSTPLPGEPPLAVGALFDPFQPYCWNRDVVCRRQLHIPWKYRSYCFGYELRFP